MDFWVSEAFRHQEWCSCESKGLSFYSKSEFKLLLGQKLSYIGIKRSQESDCLKEEFQDLVILAQYTGCPKKDLFWYFWLRQGAQGVTMFVRPSVRS